MPFRADQPPSLEPGHAHLVGQLATALDPATLEVAMVRLDTGSPQFLDPTSASGWNPGERWFRPNAAWLDGGNLSVEVGPAVAWQLQPFKPYILKFRDASGQTVEDRISWSAIRLPSEPPAVRPEPEPTPTPATATAEAPPEALAEEPLSAFADMAEEAERLRATPTASVLEAETAAPARGGGFGRWIAAAVVVFAIIGGGVFAYLEFAGTGGEGEPAGIPLSLDGARTFLTSDPRPTGENAAREAARFIDADVFDGAFLIYRFAAREGHGEAAYQLARFYDPATFEASRGPVAEADAETALDWYEQAGEAGHVEAMLRAGQLFQEGASARSDAPERAQFWLQKAADAGNETARELLR